MVALRYGMNEYHAVSAGPVSHALLASRMELHFLGALSQVVSASPTFQLGNMGSKRFEVQLLLYRVSQLLRVKYFQEKILRVLHSCTRSIWACVLRDTAT